MEEKKSENYGGTGEAEVDYSIAAGTREEIRRPQETASQTFETKESDITNNEKMGYTYDAPNTDFSNNSQSSVEFNNNQQFQEFPYGSSSKPPREKKKMSEKMKRTLSIILIICLCGVAGFGGGAIAVNVFDGNGGGSGGTQTINIDDSDATSLNAANVIAKKAMPSVVGISTISQTYTQTIFGLQQGTSQGIGTGIIVSEDGYIITNSHVVDGGKSTSITVDLYDGSQYKGNVLWSDETLDLAVVKIDAKELTAAEIGDSDAVEIGDYSVAIGNPLGLDFERSVTQGIISGLNRTITTTDGTSQNTMEGLIQTDASINSGNSGGPLLNSKGQVIGINTAKASSAEGLGFAIPINTVVPIIEEIKTSGTYEQSYLGISGYDLEDIIANYQTDFKATKGVYVAQIYTNSPAASAGIIEGDIVTAVNGKTVEDMTALKKELVNYRPGDTIKITIERNKSDKTVEVTLAASSEINQNVLQGSSYNGDSSGNGAGNYGDSYGNNNGGYYYGGSSDPFGGIFGN